MTTWLPLESNPEVLSKYISQLGVSKEWKVVDVLGLDKELLDFIPKPVKALILLFPCSDAYESHRAEEDKALQASPPKYPSDMFYMKQVIHNACGTIALVHGILNNKDIELSNGILKDYFEKAKELSPEERGKILEADTAFTNTNQSLAEEGQTATPNIDDKVNHHFVAFIHKDGQLYELDGRKSFPIQHGLTTPETLVYDAAEICKKFMARDPSEIRFNILALARRED